MIFRSNKILHYYLIVLIIGQTETTRNCNINGPTREPVKIKNYFLVEGGQYYVHLRRFIFYIVDKINLLCILVGEYMNKNNELRKVAIMTGFAIVDNALV